MEFFFFKGGGRKAWKPTKYRFSNYQFFENFPGVVERCTSKICTKTIGRGMLDHSSVPRPVSHAGRLIRPASRERRQVSHAQCPMQVA